MTVGWARFCTHADTRPRGQTINLSAHPTLFSENKFTQQRLACAFDFRAFLGMLPALRNFSAEQIEELLDAAQVFDLSLGALLFEAGASSTACYVVVQGALEISREQDGIYRRIGILGPGRLCGILALIEGQCHSMSATAREHATLLEIPHAAFKGYYEGVARGALKFQ